MDYKPLHTQDGEGSNSSSTKCSKAGWVLAVIFLGVSIALGVLYSQASTSSSSSSNPANSNDAQLLRVNVTQTMLNAMNLTADPCQDYYEYACGGWLAKTPIPDDKSQLYWVIDDISDANEAILKNILEDVLDWPLINKFYRICMDSNTTNTLGLSPLNSLLTSINNLPASNNLVSLFSLIGVLHSNGVNSALFSFGSAADLNDPFFTVGQLNGPSLNLGDKSLYNFTDPSNTDLLNQYQQHIATMLAFIDPTTAVAYSKLALGLEAQLANISLSSVAQRDINGTYNRLDFDGIVKATSPFIQEQVWTSYFNSISQGALVNPPVNVQSVSFLINMAQLVSTVDTTTLKAYLTWQLIHTAAPFLSAPIANENFRFFQSVLNGVAAQPLQWKSCVNSVDSLLGQALGRYYIQKAFSVAGKQTAIDMMNTVLASMKLKLETVEWMDSVTKVKAQQKLSQFAEQIGWPNEWESFSALSLPHTSYFADAFAATNWAFSQQINAIQKKVNRNIWTMTTPTVNAYYDPSSNQIVIPAGILQGLYFNALFHPAINYGGTGGTMGHEMTHGFDDQGSQFDGTGKFQNWWSAPTLLKWNNRTECLASFYSKYEPLPGLHIDGHLTNGENIADVGGIKQAYNAYQNYLKSKPIVPGLDVTSQYFTQIPSLDNNKLFFLAYAQGWCVKTRPESLRNQLLTNPHSPGKYRVNGPLAMFPTFGELYNCPLGSPMRPLEVCDVW